MYCMSLLFGMLGFLSESAKGMNDSVVCACIGRARRARVAAGEEIASLCNGGTLMHTADAHPMWQHSNKREETQLYR